MVSGIWPAPGRSFLAASPTVAELSLFFKNVDFSETIRDFDVFVERVGCPKLR